MSADPFASLLAAGADHPSEFALDRWHAKELPEPQARALETHAAACVRCAARLEERARGFAALAAPEGEPPIDERRVLAGIRRGLDERPAPRAPRWPAILAGTLAAAASLLLIARRAEHPKEPAPREKGGLSLHVFREVDGRALEALSGDRFASGDRLQFVADLPLDGEVRVLGVEASGALYTAWPLDASAVTRLPRGRQVALPGAVQLDRSQGRETLYLVECADSSAVDSCHAAPGEPLRCAASCELSSFVLEKH